MSNSGPHSRDRVLVPQFLPLKHFGKLESRACTGTHTKVCRPRQLGTMRHLYLLLHKKPLDELAVPLSQPSVVHANAELQRVPQVRVLRSDACVIQCQAQC